MAKSKSIKVYEYNGTHIFEKGTTKYLSDCNFEKSAWRDNTGSRYDEKGRKLCQEYYHKIENAWDDVVRREQPDPNKVFYQSQKQNIESMRANVNGI